jgi:hypothetical protein
MSWQNSTRWAFYATNKNNQYHHSKDPYTLPAEPRLLQVPDLRGIVLFDSQRKLICQLPNLNKQIKCISAMGQKHKHTSRILNAKVTQPSPLSVLRECY